MSRPDTCVTGTGGLWIEQRVQEELENQGKSGDSLREIGRKVAAEVEKYFETKVNPRTIEKRAERSATNVEPTETPEITDVLGGGSGGLFPAETAPEIPKITADLLLRLPKRWSRKRAVVHRKVCIVKTGNSFSFFCLDFRVWL